MSAATEDATEDAAAGLAFVADAAERHGHAADAIKALQPLLALLPSVIAALPALLPPLAELPGLFEDVPRLVALAKRGLLDQALIQQHAGHRERAQAVRDLHTPLELLGSRQICVHCSSEFRVVLFPCPTLVVLDG